MAFIFTDIEQRYLNYLASMYNLCVLKIKMYFKIYYKSNNVVFTYTENDWPSNMNMVLELCYICFIFILNEKIF